MQTVLYKTNRGWFTEGAAAGDPTELPVLGEAQQCQTYFVVPGEVRTSTDTPLFIKASIDGMEGIYQIYPTA